MQYPLLTTSAWKEKLHVEHGNDLVMLDKTQKKDRWQDETYYKKWSCNPMVDWIKSTSMGFMDGHGMWQRRGEHQSQ